MEKTEAINGVKSTVTSGNQDTSIKKAALKKKSENHANIRKNLPNIALKINRPLVLLKVAMFCWFGAGAVLAPFIELHLKQLGLTVETISIIYIISPFFQFLGSVASGIIADKLGRSKPILQANLLLIMAITTSILFIPGLKSTNCSEDQNYCHSEDVDSNRISTQCGLISNGSNILHCTFHCPFERKHKQRDFCLRNHICSCEFLSSYNLCNLTFQNETLTACGEGIQIEDNDLECQNHVVNQCNYTCSENVGAVGTENLCELEGKTTLFVLSGVLMIAFNTFYSASFRIFEVTAMSMVTTHNSDFGIQRFWCILGLLTLSPLSGYVITRISPENGEQIYDPAFYMFDVLVLAAFLAVWKLDVKIEPPSKGMLRKLGSLLKNPDIVAFLITVFVLGSSWGFVAVFANLYLQELNASSFLMGLARAIHSLVGLPFLLTSKWFLKKLGSANLLILALLGYFVSCTGYSFLHNPWWCLAYEITAVVTYHLLWVTVVTHSHQVSPSGLTALAISAAGAIHFAMGIGSGSLIGGLTMSKFGGRVAFRVMGTICFVTAVLYGTYLLWRKRITERKLDLTQIGNAKIGKPGFAEKFTQVLS